MASVDPAASVQKNLQTMFHDASTMVENFDLLAAMSSSQFAYEKLALVRQWQGDIRATLLALFGEQFGGMDR